MRLTGKGLPSGAKDRAARNRVEPKCGHRLPVVRLRPFKARGLSTYWWSLPPPFERLAIFFTGLRRLNEGGDFDKLGRGAIWAGEIEPCVHQNHVFAIRPFGVTAEWLNGLTGAAYARYFFMGRSKQSTNLASISSTNLMELPVPLPPEAEQRHITEQIAVVDARLSNLLTAAEEAIDLLQERRAALISAAVTGKIDVRERVSGMVAA